MKKDDIKNRPDRPKHLPKVQIDAALLGNIPLRYYREWTIEFNVSEETFQAPTLNLSGFSNVKDLEKAMDRVIELRG